MIQLYLHVKNRLAQYDGERGATAVEYGLMVALIAAFIAVSVGLLGVDVKAAFDKATAGDLSDHDAADMEAGLSRSSMFPRRTCHAP